MGSGVKMSEGKFNLTWSLFESSLSNSFRKLYFDNDFVDVTLACEDGKQIEAHKVILSSSPFFMNTAKELMLDGLSGDKDDITNEEIVAVVQDCTEMKGEEEKNEQSREITLPFDQQLQPLIDESPINI